MATCIAIVNKKSGKVCGAETLGPCNLCKTCMLELLMIDSKSSGKVKKERAPSFNAYLDYSRDMRAKVKAKNPEMSNQDITRELGKMWQAIKKKESKQYKSYVKKAQDAKAEYEAGLEAAANAAAEFGSESNWTGDESD